MLFEIPGLTINSWFQQDMSEMGFRVSENNLIDLVANNKK
jgi:hypothetical protein